MKWVPRQLGSLSSWVTSGGTPSTKESSYYDGDIPWLRTQEVNFNFITDTEIKITEAGLENSAAKQIPENSVIVALYGNSSGRVAINKIPLTTNQACGNFIIDPSEADYRFVYYSLLKDYEVLHGMARGAAQNNLNVAQVKEYVIKVPPTIGIQQRIGDILTAYDDLIENNQRRMALLDEAARQLYREWFVRLRFPGYEHARITKGVPGGWEKTNALEAMNVLSGGTPKTTVPDYWDGNIPFYTPKDASEYCYVLETERHITELGLKNCNSRLYASNTIFVSARGTVGKLNLVHRPMAMSQSCYALIGKGHISPFFLYCALKESIEYLKQHAVGAVFDAIVVDTFKLIPFMVPDNKIVRLFEETVSPMFSQVGNLLEQNQKLRAARDVLLPRLMNGEISV